MKIMKTQNKIFYTVLFLFLGLLIFVAPIKNVWAYIIPIEQEDGSGGSAANPAPPAQPASDINLVVSLDKSTYNIGEAMILSGTVSRTACGNSVVNMDIDGQIVLVTDYSDIYSNTALAGGTVATFSNSSFVAPATAGIKTFRLNAYTYSPAFYYVELTDSATYLVKYTLADLIYEAESTYGYSYDEGAHSFVNPETLEGFPLGYVNAGTEVLSYAVIEISFTVVAPPIVTVYVDDVLGPITKNTGDTVRVTWTTENIPTAEICTCKCTANGTDEIDCGTTYIGSSDCGSGKGFPYQNASKNPFTLVRPTVFKVTCALP
jgi:hypothetical protein